LSHLYTGEVGGELVAGGRVPPGNAGEGGEQVVAVLVRLHQQEVTEYHRLQLLLLLLHAAYGDFLRYGWVAVNGVKLHYTAAGS